MRPQVGVLRTDGCPRALDEGRLQPRGSVAYARRPPLAGALVAAGTQPRPRHEMARRRESQHVCSELAHHHARRGLADAGDRRQELDVLAKGVELLAHARLQVAHSLLQSVDLFEVQPNQEAVVVAHVTPKRLDELGARRLQSSPGKINETLGICLARDERIEDGPTALAQHVADDAGKLNVRVLECLLKALRVARNLTNHLLARAH